MPRPFASATAPHTRRPVQPVPRAFPIPQCGRPQAHEWHRHVAPCSNDAPPPACFDRARGRLHTLKVACVAALRDVFGHRAVGKEGLLRHVAQDLTMCGGVERGHINTIQCDSTALRLQKAQQALEQRAFSGAGSAHQGHRLPRLDTQANAVQRGTAVERMADLFKRNGTARTGAEVATTPTSTAMGTTGVPTTPPLESGRWPRC